MKKYLLKARGFLDSEEPEDLIHACLELRMAIEHHVYEKLNYFSKRHGTKLLYKSWQPDRALKILCQIEPRADQSYTLSFAEEDAEGNPKTKFKQVGKHEALSTKWTRKYYNKLGSYLHLRQKSKDAPIIKKGDLEPIYQELVRVAQSNLIGDLGNTIYFECQLCKGKITTCVDALPDIEMVYCPNYVCNATYLAEFREDEWQFVINATDFECPDCKNKQLVLENELKIGSLIKCNNCKIRYVIARHSYGLQKHQS